MELVVLVDEGGRDVGVMEKLRAHREGRLHRAFSIFVFNRRGEVLLQRRALGKYHSGGLWSNACCSHPRPGESVLEAAHRRLVEEMGFDCELKEAFTFIYRADVGNGLVEYEYDHVLIGVCEADPKPDPSEVMEWKWAKVEDVLKDIREHPEKYTYWFKLAFEKAVEAWKEMCRQPSS